LTSKNKTIPTVLRQADPITCFDFFASLAQKDLFQTISAENQRLFLLRSNELLRRIYGFTRSIDDSPRGC